MADIKVINLADKKEYTIDVHKNGENQMICPECSATRKKKTDKCFSFNLNKGAGRCNHCGIVLVENKLDGHLSVSGLTRLESYLVLTWSPTCLKSPA